MPDATACAPVTVTIAEHTDGSAAVRLAGTLNIEACSSLLARLTAIVEKYKAGSVVLDLADIVQADDYGVFFLKEIKRIAVRTNTDLFITNISEAVKKSIDLFSRPDRERPLAGSAVRATPALFISDVGDTTLAGMQKIEASLTFLGAAAIAMVRALALPRHIRLGDTIELIQKNGVNGIPITALISFITGLIIAFVASVKLEQFGGHIFIPSLITFAMVSEIGPIMTAIVVAGRTGSAYAAEIGTMKISEEIDALTSMGFDPVLFLVVPRMLALFLALPILTIFSVIAALLGGLTVCVTLLNLMPGPYLQGVLDALFLEDIIWGLSKSCVFALLIALIGCLRGFQVRGGASSVGNAATSAVVSGIFLIIFSDSITAIIRIYWG
jgi:phospholipid/cholesterol/gamma-HCH transport system permease protein